MRGPSSRSLCAILSFGLLAACGDEAPTALPPRPVKTVVITLAQVSDVGSFTGEVKARTETDLGFRIAGKLRDRKVDVGQLVAREEILAQLDETNEINAMRIAEAQLRAAEAELQDAKGNEQRQRTLFERGYTTQANLDAAVRRLKTAEANAASATTTLADAQERLRYTSLRADGLGVITAVGAQPGQVVSAGQMVVRLARTGEKEAVFNVPEQLFRNVRPRPVVRVSLLSDPTITANGSVREIAPAADPVTRTFTVRISLQNPPDEMRLGSAVVGRVDLESEEVATLPPTSLFRDHEQPAVWLFDPATSTVALKQVTVLRYENDKVLISGGLADGDRVVVAGVQKLRPGMPVRLLEGAVQ